MVEKVEIEGVELVLSEPDDISVMKWIGGNLYKNQLIAAWSVVDKDDIPLNPQILGKPGTGKTTLAYATGKTLNLPVYIFQCTMDTRPEDLIITPVIAEGNKIKYHASSLVSAMIKGGVCILDEANRMAEKSWASLAPLLDNRRYIESIIAGIKIKAHPNFRICVTMNEDSSTFEVPEYIHSRLQPQIFIEFPDPETEYDILKYNVPFTKEDILSYVRDFLQYSHQKDNSYSVRDGVNICRYYIKNQKPVEFIIREQVLKRNFKKADKNVIGEIYLIMDLLILGEAIKSVLKLDALENYLEVIERTVKFQYVDETVLDIINEFMDTYISEDVLEAVFSTIEERLEVDLFTKKDPNSQKHPLSRRNSDSIRKPRSESDRFLNLDEIEKMMKNNRENLHKENKGGSLDSVEKENIERIERMKRELQGFLDPMDEGDKSKIPSGEDELFKDVLNPNSFELENAKDEDTIELFKNDAHNGRPHGDNTFRDLFDDEEDLFDDETTLPDGKPGPFGRSPDSRFRRKKFPKFGSNLDEGEEDFDNAFYDQEDHPEDEDEGFYDEEDEDDDDDQYYDDEEGEFDDDDDLDDYFDEDMEPGDGALDFDAFQDGFLNKEPVEFVDDEDNKPKKPTSDDPRKQLSFNLDDLDDISPKKEDLNPNENKKKSTVSKKKSTDSKRGKK